MAAEDADGDFGSFEIKIHPRWNQPIKKITVNTRYFGDDIKDMIKEELNTNEELEYFGLDGVVIDNGHDLIKNKVKKIYVEIAPEEMMRVNSLDSLDNLGQGVRMKRKSRKRSKKPRRKSKKSRRGKSRRGKSRRGNSRRKTKRR